MGFRYGQGPWILRGIVGAHRISTIMDADEIVVLDDGRFTERGGHDGLMLAGGRYAALVHRQLPASLQPS
ncbi:MULTISPECIES: hypothetical protein [Streptomyces violaceusniger group]|uniref:Uncharacterized protein n=1 Tax=Streptomyces rhizosphaericus TaxID=114699 RepID=A0ABN1P6F5_9ACTN|nr:MULTISPECIES: hypothetical protein [Streptomyces violaceusniger group]